MSAPEAVRVNTPLAWRQDPAAPTAPMSSARQPAADVTRSHFPPPGFPAKKKKPPPAASTARIAMIMAAGKLLAAGALGVSVAAFGSGRSPTLVPVRTNFWSSPAAGACGAVIFWKHVGHSIIVPACDESHLICWPQTGQAYLYSLMAAAETFHIRAVLATRFFNPGKPGQRRR